MSIRFRLALIQTAIMATVLAAFAAIVFTVMQKELDQRLDYTVYLSGLEAKRALNDILKANATAVDPFVLPDAPDYDDVTLYVQLVAPDGTVLRRSDNLSADLPVDRTVLDRVLNAETKAKDPEDQTLEVGDERLAVYSARWEIDSAISPDVALVAFSKPLGNIAIGNSQTDAQSRQRFGVLQIAAGEQTYGRDLILIGIILITVVFVATGIAGVVGFRLVSKALSPVDAMSATARDIGETADFSRRLPVVPGSREPDEIGRLAQTFNQMLADLDLAFSTQRRFLADAAHELRTPLTVIRASAETWLRGGERVQTQRREGVMPSNAPDSESALAALTITREADRMGRLVADLLTLARGDVGLQAVHRPVQFDTIVVDVYRLGRTLSDDVHLTLAEFDQVTVNGDSDRLRQLVLNLVDNAIQYTPPGGSVTLELAQTPGWMSLRVRDTGPGIPEADLARIFDRFYRVDAARTRRSGGAGLGLAISQEIARAHGGVIDVESAAGQGTVFTVRLPTVPGEPAPPTV